MSSPSQIEANRHNARRSIGPQTAEGKAASSKNAMKHGLLSQDILLPQEDADAFDDLAERTRTTLQPDGELESELVDHIVRRMWRLRRIVTIEKAVIIWNQFCVLGSEEYEKQEGEDDVDYTHYARKIARKAGARDIASLGEAFSNGEDNLAKLSRYETSAERSLYRALHELQRLQAARKGQPAGVPVAVDIDVTGLDECGGVEGRLPPGD